MEVCCDCQKPIEPGQTSYVANPCPGVIHHYHSKCGDPFGKRHLTAPISMQDVRLVAGEGKLEAQHVLQAVNVILETRRLR